MEAHAEVSALIEAFTTRTDKTVSLLKSEFAAMRAGRANPHILNKVTVDYYGTPTPLQQMANISAPDARSLAITLWDASALKAVEKAILEANIGIHPSNDGKIIRLVFPELTEERRKDLVKQVKKMGEEAKVAIRNVRRDTNDSLKKLKNDKAITEDDLALYEKEVDKLCQKVIETVENTLREKEKELMSV